MTKSQKLTVRLSEIRQRLNELLEIEERAEEQNGELEQLTAEAGRLEPELRAAITAEGGEEPLQTRAAPDGESVELRGLIERANVGHIFAATVAHQSTEGETAELQQHYKLQANQVPIALLREPPEERAVTPAPANVQGNQQPIIAQVFPRSVAGFLGVDMPSVGTGEAVFPVLTTGASAHVPAKGASAAETTGAFSAEALKPGRIQASFFYAREDAALFAGMAEALRMNLSEALGDKLDAEILTGAEGLLSGSKLTDHDVSAVTTYANYRDTLAYGRVDGRYAADVSQIRIIMGAATYGHAAAQFRSQNAGDRAAIEDLQQATGGVRVSAHVPAPASNKQECVIRLGMRRDMVAPIWEGVTLIPDELTKAATGEIVITAVMMHAVKILRSAGFYKQETKHA